MISFEQALQIAIQRIGPECGLIDERTIEKPYGWYFMYQGKRWLQTRDFRDMLAGSGGFIVERMDGRIYEFGSAYPLERNFAAYEYGLKYETYNLSILRIYNLETTLDLLLTLRLTYIIPEFAYGQSWRIPKHYDRGQLMASLKSLPSTFTNCGGFFFKYEQFLEIDRVKCCEFELRGLLAGDS